MMQFDIESNMQEFTFVLSTRGHKHLGQLFNVHEPVSSVNFNAANEIVFTVYKYSDYENGIQEPLWDEITDFKYVWVKELNEYYEITVELSDEESIYKSVTGISACECELSQNYVYGLEVNTELDISRSDYKNPTIFYKPENPKESLLHRLLSYAPHYTIKHVDTSIAGIQRMFSIDGADIYSCLVDTIAPEIGCIFIFDTVDRTISAYDLKTVCNDCGERGEFSDVCPECGSTDLKYYGEDTTVLVDTENLANNITFTTDTESVKNCFKLEAGDDNMTAAVVNLNPSGTPYIYYFSEDMKHDMSDELVEKLDGYDKLHKSYDSEYSKLMSEQYECIDKIVYYTSEMMPTREDSPTDASKEAAKLTEENLSPVGLTSVTTSTSTTTVNSALKNYAKVYVKSSYFKIEINEGEFVYEGEDTEGNHYGYWYGSFKITNYSDEEDSAISPTIKVKVYDLYQTFIEQKIAKKIKDEDEEDGSVFDVLSIKDLDDFTEAIKLYCLSRLTSFYDAIQGVLDIMIEQDQANEFADLYETIYVPYKNKLDACQKEIDAREATIKGYEDRLDVAEKRQSEIHLALDFEAYIGEELYKEFCAFKREQTYSNENYISDGLDNDEIFERAKEFIDVAKKELIKSGENQHSISGSLSNILAMEEFSPLKDKFKIGNFIRIRIDSHLYRLRLIGYQIQFDENGNSNIDVEFSDVTKIRDGVTDMQSILNQVTSMSSSYDSFKNQVIGSQKSIDQVTSWIKDGLDLTNTKIVSTAKNQDIVYNKNGILVRSYDDITETYSPEQLKIINSTIAITKDNWNSIETAIGRIAYTDPRTNELKYDYGVNAKILIGKLILGESLGIYNSSNSLSFDENGFVINATKNQEGKYQKLFDIQIDGESVMYIDTDNGFKLSPAIGFEDTTLGEYIDTATQYSKNVNIILSNEYSAIPTDSNGNNGNFSSCYTTVQVFYGSEDVTNKVVFETSASNGVQYSFQNKIITVSNMTTDSGYVSIKTTYNNISVTKKFNIVKQKQGIQGIQGEQGIGVDGKDGKTSYFHIKYSSVASPTSSSQMKETPDKYIGTYVNFTESDSNNPNDYTWSQFIGDDGIPGTNGENGETSYLHIKYSNDGGTTFTSNNGEDVGLYIGQYVDFVQQDSSTPSKYKWALIKGADGQNGQDGADGEDGVVYEIISSTNTIKITESNNFLPTSVTFSAIKRIGSSGNTTAYSGSFKIEESTNGSTYTTKYTSSANESSKTWSPSSTDVISIRCSLYLAGGTTTLLDIQSVTILTDVSQLTQQIVFNKLTNNGQLQGLFMQDGNLYINASYLSTGIIADKAGKFSLNMTTGKAILRDGEFSGKITATSGTIGGWTIANSYLNCSAHNGSLNVDFTTKIDATSGNVIFTSSNSTYTTEVGIDGIHFETGWSEGDRWVYRDVVYGLDGIESSGNIMGEYFSLNGHGVQFGPPETSVGWANNGGVLKALGSGELENIKYINGLRIGGANGNQNKSVIPVIGSDGVMEVGTYIDFHPGNYTDYSPRLTASTDGTLTSTGRIGASAYNVNGYLLSDWNDGISLGWGAYNAGAGLHVWGNSIDFNCNGDSIQFRKSTNSTYSAFFHPSSNGKVTLGTSGNRWFRLYQSQGSIDTSDEREKHSIIAIKDLNYNTKYSLVENTDKNVFEVFFNNLIPKIYCMNNDSAIENNKIHIGFVAQDISKILNNLGIQEDEAGLIDHSYWTDEDTGEEKDLYGLCYTEFIALNTYMIQKSILRIDNHDKEIQELRNENAQLTQEIKKLQDKLDAFINGNFEIREANV